MPNLSKGLDGASSTTAAETLTGIKTFEGASASADVLRTRVVGDTDPRMNVDADGTISWGGGAGAADTFLERGGGALLRTPSDFTVNGSFNVGSGSSATISGGLFANGSFNRIGNQTTDALSLYGAPGAAQAASIADAAGGAIIDAEARAALNSLLATVRHSTGIGIIAG